MYAQPHGCLPRPLKPPALARGGNGQIKHRLADTQVARDPCVDLGILGAYLALLQTGPDDPRQGPVSALCFSSVVLLAGALATTAHPALAEVEFEGPSRIGRGWERR